MTKFRILMTVLLFGLGSAFAHSDSSKAPKIDPNAKKFGSAITLKKAQSLGSAIAAYKDKKSSNVLVRGKVEKVCKKKGCWMVIKDGSQEVRVTFKDYGFFVPAQILGKKVHAQGELVQRVIPVEELRHFAEDEGKSKEEIAKIKKPQKIYRFVAAGVEVKS